jgi:hypothetical protein
MTRSNSALLLVVGSALLGGACRDASDPTGPTDGADSPALQQVSQAPSPDLLTVAKAVPGFGGLFLDRNGTPTVYLTDPRGRGAAERALAGFVRSEGFAPSQLRVLKGDFEYLQLDDWFNRASPAVLALAGAVLVDLDEGSNRVRIGVEHASAATTVRSLLARLNIPAAAVVVEQTEPIHLAATLRQRVRPVRGGLQINFPGFLCTLGFNARRSGVNSFVTNSHCTTTQGGTEGTRYFQLTANDFIGTEVADPRYFRGGVCPPGRRCRFSDASRAAYASGVAFNLARIARTTSRGKVSGSITISGPNPFFTITAERANPVQGAQANKIGRTTGWTFGTISATCVNTNVSGTNITQLCQSRVNAGVGGGDSGSPVFSWPGTGGNVTLLGILWGMNSPTQFVFSPMSGIERAGELGALATF